MRFDFGPFSLDTERLELRRGAERVPLRRKPFEVLRLLLERHARVVSDEELVATVWPGLAVSPTVLAHCISEIRAALCDGDRSEFAITNVYGRGYRFDRAGSPAAAPGPDAAAAAPEAVAAPAEEPGPGADGAAEPLSAAVREALAGEARVVSVLACDVGRATPKGPSARAGRAAPRATPPALLRDAVERYGGTVQSLGPRGGLAVFGAPRHWEDHARRALLAGFRLHNALAGAPGGAVAARLALHSGGVLVAAAPSDGKLALSPVGDTFDRALALLQAAPAPAIVLSETIRVQLGSLARTARVAGTSAHRLLGLRRRAEWRVAGASRMVGRERDLAELRAAMKVLLRGEGRAVGIVGEAGIGKTRLLAELRRAPGAGAAWAAGRCLSHGRNVPYGAVTGILEDLCGIGPDDEPAAMAARLRETLERERLPPAAHLPLLLPLLGQGGAGPGSVPAPRAATFEALHSLVLRCAARRPLVVEVEDLHWVDPTSEAWLDSLALRIARRPVLLLTTYRPGYRPPWGGRSWAVQRTLERLGRRDSRALVRDNLGDADVPAPLREGIVARGGGNPLFLESLARSWRALAASGELPEDIRTLVAARLDGLARGTRLLLRGAAVLGPAFDPRVLQALVGAPAEQVLAGLREAVEAELLVETGEAGEPAWRFGHSLVRDAVYGGMLRRSRCALHARIAQLLLERFPEIVERRPQEIAHHLVEAGRAPEAIGHWARAAGLALQRSAGPEAVECARRALGALASLPPDHPLRALELTLQAMLGTGLTLTRSFADPEVRAAFERAAALSRASEGHSAAVAAMAGLAAWCLQSGNGASRETVERELRRLAREARAPADRMIAGGFAGVMAATGGRVREATATLGRAVRLYEPGWRPDIVRTHGFDLGMVVRLGRAGMLVVGGRAASALREIDEVRRDCLRLGHPLTLALAYDHACLALLLGGCDDEARPLAAEGARLCALHGLNPLQNRLILLAADRHRPGGVERLGKLAADLAKGEFRSALTLFLVLCADACAAAGRGQQGLRRVAEARAEMDRSGDRLLEPELLRIHGELLLLQRRPGPDRDGARERFEQARATARRQGALQYELRAATSLARTAQGRRRGEDARRLRETIDRFPEKTGAPYLEEARRVLAALAAPARAAGAHGPASG